MYDKAVKLSGEERTHVCIAPLDMSITTPVMCIATLCIGLLPKHGLTHLETGFPSERGNSHHCLWLPHQHLSPAVSVDTPEYLEVIQCGVCLTVNCEEVEDTLR